MDTCGDFVKEKRRDKNGWNINEEKRVEKLKMKRAIQYDAQLDLEEKLASGEVVSKRAKKRDKKSGEQKADEADEVVVDPLFGLPRGQKNRLKQQMEGSDDSC